MTDIVEKLKKGENLSFEESKTLFTDLMEGKHSEDSIIEILESFIRKGVRSSLIPILKSFFQNCQMRVKWKNKSS